MALPLTAKDVVNDLYGFQISVTVQQQAVRLQADGVSSGTEGLWLPFVQSMTLPPENKLKGMIRKVGPYMCRYIALHTDKCIIITERMYGGNPHLSCLHASS